jgi:hypothetical protein
MRDCLRREFHFRCCYCLGYEVERSTENRYANFEIEHHFPESKFRALRARYSNLLWACRACNEAKLAKMPTAEDAALGCRWLSPSIDNMNEHLEVTGFIVAEVNDSAAGRYVIDELRLDRGFHPGFKERRALKAVLLDTLLTEIEELAADVVAGVSEAERTMMLAQLQRKRDESDLMFPAMPHDAPTGCMCRTRPARP